MRRLQRLGLSAKAEAFLRKRKARVAGATDPRKEAERLWRLRDNNAFREIRESLSRMASGLERCMYCEDSQGTGIDHFWPQTPYPNRAFDWDNYLLACAHCNSHQKRDRFPLSPAGLPLLIDPTVEDPLNHLTFSPSTGRYEPGPGSAKGSPSIEVFGLNRAILIRGRHDAWVVLGQLLIRYAESRRQGEDELSARIEDAVRRHPFAGVLAVLLQIAAGPEPALFLTAGILEAIRQNPEILTWS